MLEQERQVAGLRARIAALEGGGSGQPKPGMPQSSRGGSSVDDFTIKVGLESLCTFAEALIGVRVDGCDEVGEVD